MKIMSTDEKVKSDTIKDLKEFNNQSLATQVKKGEQLVFMMPAIEKAFVLMGNHIVELSTENDVLKNRKGSNDQQWLEESRTELLKQIDDQKRANLNMSRKKKQMKKH